MAFCVECDEEYPDLRATHPDLCSLARAHCVTCWDKRVPMRAIKADNAKRMVLAHKDGYKLVRSVEDVRAITTGKPNGTRTF
jgi:hypothetical protein